MFFRMYAPLEKGLRLTIDYANATLLLEASL